MKFILFLLILSVNIGQIKSELEPCNPLELPDICGFYPSLYTNLSLSGVPPLCNANCTYFEWDQCGICNGLAPLNLQYDLLFPTLYPASPMTRIGGSVASWNGNVAASQHIAQVYPVVVKAPVVTWRRSTTKDADGNWTFAPYVIPSSTDGTTENFMPLSRGYGLGMSENYLVIGNHDSTPRIVQLWVKSNNPPWVWVHTMHDPCAGNYFGFSVTVNERIPGGGNSYGVVAVGDPAAFLSGRVYVYFTYSPGILQTLQFGNFSTDRVCFGESVDADLDLLVVGAPRMTVSAQSGAGTVFVYRWNGLTYDLAVQISPPSPSVNLGFGESVSVWDDMVLIGDNQRRTYLYRIVGGTAIPSPLAQPGGLNLVSRHGYAVGIWDWLLVSGDEEYVPSPTKKGTTFVYTQNPLQPTSYMRRYDLEDSDLFVNTRYGAAVSVKGGCFVASGIPQRSLYGGVVVRDLCRDQCYGCDGVLNSCLDADFCGVCNGDNSTCLGCDGMPNSNTTIDLCGVCNGTNTTCVILPVSNYNTTCHTPVIIPLSNVLFAGLLKWSVISPTSKGTAAIVGITNTIRYVPNMYESGLDTIWVNVTIVALKTWQLVSINVTIDLCPDCFNVTGGPARPDSCGVCGGDNSTCLGCDGIANSGKVIDYCGVCGGTNSTCLDIIEPPMINASCVGHVVVSTVYEPSEVPVVWHILAGTGYINSISGFLLWTNPGIVGEYFVTVQVISTLNTSVFNTVNFTFSVPNCTDCSGLVFGVQLFDLCGVCGGDSKSCLDCAGVPNGLSVQDACGVCGGDNSTCPRDCFGDIGGIAKLDACGVCNGDNSTCKIKGGIILPIIGFILLMVFLLLVVFLFLEWLTDWRFVTVNWKERYFPKIETPPPPTYINPKVIDKELILSDDVSPPQGVVRLRR